MSASRRWIVGCSIWVPVLIACSGANTTFTDGDSGEMEVIGEDGGVTYVPSSSGASVGLFKEGDATTTNSGPCQGGKYAGSFTGLYTSHLTGVGIPIPVAGNVDLTLNQAGGSGSQCMVEGEGLESCSNVFTLQDGTITGVADELGDSGVGGFPYFCTMTGTLDCMAKKLVNGWIQCTYCVGPLADGGMACTLANGLFGTTGVGGHFAGPLNANYDYNTLAFVMGTWNGAEALAGNDGGSPGPDGAAISTFLSDSGLYLGPGDFGGSGQWGAAHQ
jgi:hypothetical protein